MRKILIVFCLIFALTSIATGYSDPFSVVEEKLDGISDEEKQVLGNLFKLIQEIEIIDREKSRIEQEIQKLNYDIAALETKIAKDEESYARKQNGLEQVLKSYQRMGPSSYIEIILNSDSLASFLRRINILRDLARDTGELLEELEDSKEEMIKAKDELAERLSIVKDKQRQANEALERENRLKADLEEYLASLEGEKKHYQDRLVDMHKAWDELKIVFADTAKKFSKIAQEGNFPPDALKISFSVNGVKGSIDEETFNEITSKQADLERMIVDFEPGRMAVELPDKNLVLYGVFIIEEENKLRFQAEGGVFFQMPLEKGSLEELFRENQLLLDLEPMLGGNTLKSVVIQEDNLELLVDVNLFQH